MLMQGQYRIIDSKLELERGIEDLKSVWNEYKYLWFKIYGGKRTLDQNALKSVWYRDISIKRGDITAKEVERECKFNYGFPIVRRDPFRDFTYSIVDKFENFKVYDTKNFGKKTGLELKHLAMDGFAVTSIMTPEECGEYLTAMKNDYPYLRGRND